MVLTHGRTGKPFATKYAHQVFGQERVTLDDAFPGDVIGLVNANEVRVGDTLYLDEAVEFPRLPAFAPTHFATVRVKDTQRFKQFRKAVSQLDEEGVVQVLRDIDMGDQIPMFAAVGPMQFDVAMWRLETRVQRAGHAVVDVLFAGPPDRRGQHAQAAFDAGRHGRATQRRGATRAVREPLLARAAQGRPP